MENYLDVISRADLRWDLFFKQVPLTFLAGAIVVAVLLWFLWKVRDQRDFIYGPKELGATNEGLKLFYGLVPAILGIHVAVALLIHGIQGRLFSAHHILEGLAPHWIGLAEITIALSLFYGGLTYVSAVIIGLLWFLGIDLLGLRSMLESIQYLGYAAFFYLAGRGPFSIDRILFPKMEPVTNYTGYALLSLRIGVGLNLIIYGLVDKLANIPYASYFLDERIFPNVVAIPNDIFVMFAGAGEVLAGILIVFGIFSRTTILITLGCMNALLTVSNWNELVDFLPLYGALAILLVWNPSDSTQKLLWVEGIRRPMPERSGREYNGM